MTGSREAGDRGSPGGGFNLPSSPEDTGGGVSHLCFWNAPKRPISSDASLSGACGASSRRK